MFEMRRKLICVQFLTLPVPNVLLCSIAKLFDFRMFDCVRLAKVLVEFDHVRLPNPIEVNPTTGVQLGLIAERLIDYGGI